MTLLSYRPRSYFRAGFLAGLAAFFSCSAAANPQVERTARFGGNYGLRVDAAGAGAVFVQDDSPSGEKRYRARFYLRPDRLTLNPGSEFSLFSAYDSGGNPEFSVVVHAIGQAKNLTLEIWDDNGQSQRLPSNAEIQIGADWHSLEVAWKSDPTDGSVELWMDGISVAAITQVVNGTAQINSVKLGKIDAVPTGGYLEFDEFASARDEAIGLIAPLFPSFNLYSFPGDPAQITCSQLETQLGIQTIKRYDGVSETFIPCDPLSANFTIQPGEGYLLAAPQTATQPVGPDFVCPVFNLSKGFNLIGINAPAFGSDCFSILQKIGDATEVATIQHFAQEDGRFQSCGYSGISNTLYGQNFLIRPGAAYLVNMRASKAGVKLDDPNHCP